MNKRTSELDIVKALDLLKLYEGRDSKIELLLNVPNGNRIEKIFKLQEIESNGCIEVGGDSWIEDFTVGFGPKVYFQDVYIVVALLANFGIEGVIYKEELGDVISIWTNQGTKRKNGDVWEICVGMEPDEFLDLPFHLDMATFISEQYSPYSRPMKEKPADYYDEYDPEALALTEEHERKMEAYYADNDMGAPYSKYGGPEDLHGEPMEDRFIDDALDGDPDAIRNIQ